MRSWILLGALWAAVAWFALVASGQSHRATVEAVQAPCYLSQSEIDAAYGMIQPIQTEWTCLDANGALPPQGPWLPDGSCTQSLTTWLADCVDECDANIAGPIVHAACIAIIADGFNRKLDS